MPKHALHVGLNAQYRRIVFAVLIAFTCSLISIAIACPYCPPTDATLSEKLAECDAACVVKFLDSKNGEELSQQTTRFEVLKPFPTRPKFRKGQRFEVPFGVTAKPGDQFLIMGQSKDGEMEWGLPVPLDELGSEYNYLVKAPPPESGSSRLEYFLGFLESKIPVISNDAYAEFARAKFEDVEAIAPKLSRTQIRAKLEDPDSRLDVRRSFYGMLLGLCGNEDDARYLEQKVLAPIDPGKFRFGIDGMMGGYLLLRRQAGLKTLMEKKVDAVPIDVAVDDPRATDFEAVRVTLNFVWDFRHKDFTEESLIVAMRKLLDRSQVAESAVKDLARWKDWHSLDKLIAAYGKDPFDTRGAKEKIIAFALSCLKDERTSPGKELAEYGVKAQQFLDGLDPDFVQKVRRSFGGLSPSPDSIKPASPEKKSSDAGNSGGAWKANFLFIVAMGIVLFIIKISI